MECRELFGRKNEWGRDKWHEELIHPDEAESEMHGLSGKYMLPAIREYSSGCKDGGGAKYTLRLNDVQLPCRILENPFSGKQAEVNPAYVENVDTETETVGNLRG